MLRLFALHLLMFSTLLPAEEPGKAKLAAPAGWGGETIQLPPGFAPDMKLKGTEQIRFAPGMMNPDSDSFFCYVIVFDIQPKPALTDAVIKDEFLKYYRGLCKAVLKGKLPDVDPSTFTLELQRVNPDDSALASKTSYTGTLDWVEPFATKERQKLNVEIQTWPKDERSFILVCVSPQARDSEIWSQLHTIRDDYIKQHAN